MRNFLLADLHLARHVPDAVTADLKAFLRGHPASRIVFVGDLFDFPSEGASESHERALMRAAEANAEIVACLGEHVSRGGELWLVSGNHDPGIGEARMGPLLRRILRLSESDARRVVQSPWFLRLGRVHVEHGHLFDPDNALPHPLASSFRSLGTHFVESFIAPTGAHRYLNANAETPLKLFLSSFAWYGWRGPYVVYRYFHTAFTAMAQSGLLYRGDALVPEARSQEEAFAATWGVSPSLLRSLVARAATPTMSSFHRTFARIYFDRVVATLALAGGSAALAAKRPAGLVPLLTGAAIMAASWWAGHDRYRGAVSARLARGAEEIASLTAAPWVVFGHTHEEHLSERYANTGSFSFAPGAPGRPYLEIEEAESAPKIVRRYWT